MRRLILMLCALVTASLLASPAAAFCGFYVSGGGADLYNEATQAVLMRQDKTTVLSMQNNYQGPTDDFAMVVPVPQILQEANVKTLPKEIFDKVDTLSAPRLVEYWERDPCGGLGLGMYGMGRGGGGFGGGPTLGMVNEAMAGEVVVEAEFSVGEYDIVILSASEANSLSGWLEANDYKIPGGAAPYFQPYIEQGMYFFVARVDAKKVTFQDGKAVLSPLRFHYESDDFSLPIRLGMINSRGTQDLLVYILAQNQRYEVANYPNATIPTNIEVSPRVKEAFSGFYESLFSRTVEQNPRAVVTEYAWAASKCDPCPSGTIGGGAMTAAEIQTLGGDVVSRSPRSPGRLGNRGNWGWVLTRLHARYAPDDIGEDLVFAKADAIVGGRELKGVDGSLERGATDAETNNFQGRYIIRNEWQGAVACDEPSFGIWGGPPNPAGMKQLAQTMLLELRRGKTLPDAEFSQKLLEAPATEKEREVIGFHMRRNFGTSEPPGGSMPTATSPNTRGAALSAGVASLEGLVRESIPELDVVPDPGAAGGGPAPAGQESPPDAKETAPAATVSGCSSSGGGSAGWLVFPIGAIGLFHLLTRRRRTD